MKIFIACILLVASINAEPPVSNRYLPPQQGQNGDTFSSPSRTYGPPGIGSGFGSQRQTDAVFGRRPSTNYGSPSRSSQLRPSSQYGPPSQRSQLAPSSQYGPPSQRSQSAPSLQYGPPSQLAPSSQYGPPSQRSQFVLSSQYGPPSQRSQLAPSSQYGPPSQRSQFGTPGSQYGVPSVGAPSRQYGAPGLGVGAGQQYSQATNGFASAPSSAYGVPEQSRQYLPPGNGRGGYGGDDDGNGEPANYSFEYMVNDEESGNDFGHRESRQGDRAEGLYYVLLPDGRKQTVEYEADQEGYKPRVSYEDTGLGALGLGGYDRNSQSNYQNGGPY